MSAGIAPSAGDHDGSRWSENAAAARAHCCFRCAVGATTTSRAGLAPSSCRRSREREGRLTGPGGGDREEVAFAARPRTGRGRPSASGGGERCASSVEASERPAAPHDARATIAGAPVGALSSEADDGRAAERLAGRVERDRGGEAPGAGREVELRLEAAPQRRSPAGSARPDAFRRAPATGCTSVAPFQLT